MEDDEGADGDMQDYCLAPSDFLKAEMFLTEYVIDLGYEMPATMSHTGILSLSAQTKIPVW